MAVIRGMQEGSSGDQGGRPSVNYQMMSMAKHFVDYTLEGCTPEENNCRKPRRLFYPDRHRFDANVSAQDQAEFFLAPWRAAITRARVGGLMCSYNMVQGLPMCGNPALDVRLLRGVWNWSGVMISDGGAIGGPSMIICILVMIYSH